MKLRSIYCSVSTLTLKQSARSPSLYSNLICVSARLPLSFARLFPINYNNGYFSTRASPQGSQTIIWATYFLWQWKSKRLLAGIISLRGECRKSGATPRIYSTSWSTRLLHSQVDNGPPNSLPACGKSSSPFGKLETYIYTVHLGMNRLPI